MMQRLDWWIGVGFVAIALFAHAMLRRYEVLKPEPRDLRAFQIRRSGSAICAWGWRSPVLKHAMHTRRLGSAMLAHVSRSRVLR